MSRLFAAALSIALTIATFGHFAKYLSIGLAYFSTSVLVLLLTAIFSAMTL